MERPKISRGKAEREVTAEVVYYHERHESRTEVGQYVDLSEAEMRAYEGKAKEYQDNGNRPAILDLYEKHDVSPSEPVASCLDLADILLALRPEDSRFTFEDIAVEMPAEEVRKRLETMNASSLLASADEQLAIRSDGSYYPILDIKKQDATFRGVSLRAWGWDYPKTVLTNADDETYEYKKHCLQYPSYEKERIRELDISFVYNHPEAGLLTESIVLRLNSSGGASIGAKHWMSVYAETGYEGHDFRQLDDCSEQDVALFGDLVAEMVGDEPESITMHEERVTREMMANVVSEEARSILIDLQGVLSPPRFQQLFMIRMKDGEGGALGEYLANEGHTDEVMGVLRKIYTVVQNRTQ